LKIRNIWNNRTAPVPGWEKVACEVKRADQRPMIKSHEQDADTANPGKRRDARAKMKEKSECLPNYSYPR